MLHQQYIHAHKHHRGPCARVVTMTRRPSYPCCAVAVVARACCSSVVRLEVEVMLVPVMARKVVAAGVGGGGWRHALRLELG
jgi:hypothetical protein